MTPQPSIRCHSLTGLLRCNLQTIQFTYSKSAIQCLLDYSQIIYPSPQSTLEYFLPYKNTPAYSLAIIPQSAPFPSSWQPLMCFFLSVDLPIQNIYYKWTPTIHTPEASFKSIIFSSFTCSMYQYFVSFYC